MLAKGESRAHSSSPVDLAGRRKAHFNIAGEGLFGSKSALTTTRLSRGGEQAHQHLGRSKENRNLLCNFNAARLSNSPWYCIVDSLWIC